MRERRAKRYAEFCIVLSIISLILIGWFWYRYDDVDIGKKKITKYRKRLAQIQDVDDNKVAISGHQVKRPENMDVTFPEWDTAKSVPSKTYGQVKEEYQSEIDDGYYQIHKGIRGIVLSLICMALLLWYWIPVGFGLSHGEDWSLYRDWQNMAVSFLPALMSFPR